MASIEKRGENTYRLTACAGYDINGKKLRKHKTVERPAGMTDKAWDKELQSLVVEFEKQVRKGYILDENITLQEFTEKWLEQHAEKNLEPKTLYEYKGLLDNRILPALGHLKLGKLQPIHLLEFYNNLSEPGMRNDTKYALKPEYIEMIKDVKAVNPKTIQNLQAGAHATGKTAGTISAELNVPKSSLFSPLGEEKTLSTNTINHYHRCLSAILQHAVYWQVIPFNPCERVKPPKIEKKEAAYFDEDVVEKILKLLESEPLKYRVMINIVLFSGCRLGELAGLTWDDIDIDEGTIRIQRAAQYLPGHGTYDKNTKTESGKRIVSLPNFAIQLVKTYKVWQNEVRLSMGDAWIKADRVFTQYDGKPIFPGTPTKWFKEFRHRHNLANVKFHGLRHTNASLLIGNGVNLRTVSHRLGHAKTSTTTDIYSHVLKRPDKEAADLLNTKFNPNKMVGDSNSGIPDAQ